MLRHLPAALAAIALAAAAAPAWSQPAASAPAAASSEAERLGDEMARALFSRMDFSTLIKSQMNADVDRMFNDIKGRPAWPGLMREAMLEEGAAMGPMMQRALGRRFATYFSLDELREGVGFLRGPAGAELAQVVADSANGRDAKPMSKLAEGEMRALTRTQAGKRWLEKFGNIETAMASATDDVVAAIFLDLMRRFIDKATAAEAGQNPALP